MIVSHKEYDIGNGGKIIAYYNEIGATEVSKEAFEQFIIPTLSNAEKYRWHDIRKNPDDLPKEEGEYIVCEDYGFGKEYKSLPYMHSEEFNEYYWLVGWKEKEALIAWKEIEPFEEETK